MLIKLIFLASFILLIIATILVYLSLGEVSNFIVVGIDVFRGLNFLGSVGDVWSVLGIGLAINLINLFLAAAFYHREWFLAYLLAFVSLFISLLILIAIGTIITVN